MRNLLICAAVAILSAAVWALTGRAGAAAGHGGGHGGGHGHSGGANHMRHGGGPREHIGLLLQLPFASRAKLFPGEPEPGPIAPGLLSGGVMGSASHSLARIPLRVERGRAIISQPAVAGAAESDEEGAATAQPYPAASPSSTRPSDAAGPGRPVSGQSGPGLPGPGRPAARRW
jgi:hypothetical protein